jgi:hypothetical protein
MADRMIVGGEDGFMKVRQPFDVEQAADGEEDDQGRASVDPGIRQPYLIEN